MLSGLYLTPAFRCDLDWPFSCAEAEAPTRGTAAMACINRRRDKWPVSISSNIVLMRAPFNRMMTLLDSVASGICALLVQLAEKRYGTGRNRLRKRFDVCVHVGEFLIGHDFGAIGGHAAGRGIAHKRN